MHEVFCFICQKPTRHKLGHMNPFWFCADCGTPEGFTQKPNIWEKSLYIKEPKVGTNEHS